MRRGPVKRGKQPPTGRSPIMGGHFNRLTPAEAERLALLSEELGEAVQAIGKVLRHGYESYDPTRPPEQRQSNRRDLEDEIGHVQAAVLLMKAFGDLRDDGIIAATLRKMERTKPFLHHQDGSDG